MDGFAALVVVVTGTLAIVAAGQMFLRWREYRFPELRRVLGEVEVILQGERDFTSDRGKRTERDLRDVIEQLRHGPVRRAAETVFDEWKRAFASDPVRGYGWQAWTALLIVTTCDAGSGTTSMWPSAWRRSSAPSER